MRRVVQYKWKVTLLVEEGRRGGEEVSCEDARVNRDGSAFSQREIGGRPGRSGPLAYPSLSRHLGKL